MYIHVYTCLTFEYACNYTYSLDAYFILMTGMLMAFAESTAINGTLRSNIGYRFSCNNNRAHKVVSLDSYAHFATQP